MANTAEQMKVFGYTPEGLDQEVEKYAGEAKEDFAENKLEEERRANHPLNNVPFFQRPVNASTDDIEVPTSDPDVRAFKNKFGETYTIATSSDQRVEREKLRDGIISSLEGVKGYLENPFLPNKEQVADFVKGAAVGTLEQIKQSMESGATYGDIFGTLAGVGAASTPFKVPEGSLRLFGGVSMKGAAKDKNLKKAIKTLKTSSFYRGNLPSVVEEGGIPYDLNKQIWSDTGWYVDPADGQWRYFIDDTKASLKNLDEISNLKISPDARNPTDFKTVKVSDIFDHPEFYKKYPEFKDFKITFYNADRKDSKNVNLLGSYDETTNSLKINMGAATHMSMVDGKFVTNTDALKKTLLHELQHVIQRKENFVRGASTDDIPPDLVYDKDLELRGKKEPIQKNFDQVKLEFDRIDNQLREARKAAGENPLPGLTIQQEIEIYNKHYSQPDKLRPDVTWASTAREYGVPVSVVQKAAGRTNLIGRLNRKLTQKGAVYNKLADDVYDVDRERSRIEINFYEGAGGEIEARLTEEMLDPSMTINQLESGATAKDVFPLDARAGMLEREGNLYEYQGKYGVDPFNYEVKPRREPESTNLIDTVKKKFGKSDMMIGPGGRSYQTQNLDEARALKKKGAFPEEIEAKTGRVETAPTSAYRDLDTLGVIKPIFKYEIDDSQAKLNGTYKTTEGTKSVRAASLQNPAFIGQVLDHPLLFKEYPDLAKIKFAFKDLSKEKASGVYLGYPKDIILIDDKFKNLPINDPKLRETFFHELQHAAQFEDFKKTYIMMVATDPKYLAKLTANPNISDPLSTAHITRLSKNKKLKKIKEDILNIYLKNGTSIESGSNPRLARKLASKTLALDIELYKEYLKQGNEIESRVVGERAKFLGKKPNELASTAIDKQSKLTSFKQRMSLLNLIAPISDKVLGKKPDEKLVKKGLNFAKYALGQNKKLEGFAEGGYTVRPESRPETEVDVSPRAEAGDQFFVKQAEREKAFKTKPKPRPSMDKSFSDVKPKPRPGSEIRTDVVSEEYTFDGNPIRLPVLVFKDGGKIAFQKALDNIVEAGNAGATNVYGMSGDGSMPSLEDLSDRVRNFIRQNNPTREEFETYWYNPQVNKGGLIGKQMQMAFMNEGGLTDDGMDVDPVSGNDIPSGSMAEEVRDDIPAQLSDGEYVVPADVVRYYGVKFFEDLRDQAKMGLAQMEADGRIGGEPVPAGGPMNTEELSPEEMQAIQEMMGMSEGGSVNAYKTQQELLEQPANKAVGNPVMMSLGGLSEADILGGKTSAQAEQEMLAKGKAAMDQNYIGSPLGFSIFDSPNTQTQTASLQGVQQTEVKAFAPITLYNTAGQTRTVNSIEERKSAEAAGFTMTLDQYNMYRSQRGGGGSDPKITSPDQGEDKEPKSWGQDTNWNSVSDIEKFVANAERGNLSGSGQFLRGIGYMIAGLPGVALATAFQAGKGLDSLYDMQAAQIIAEAKGEAGSKEHADLANTIQKGIDKYLETAGFVNKFYGSEMANKAIENRVNGFISGTGYDDVDSWAAGTKAPVTKNVDALRTKMQKDKTSKINLAKAKVTGIKSEAARTGKSIAEIGREKAPSSEAKSPTQKAKDEGDPRAGLMNKGGLMTKGKKKK